MLDCDLWPLDLRGSPLHYLFGDLREYHVPVMQADDLTDQHANSIAGLASLAQEHMRYTGTRSAQQWSAWAIKPPTKFELVHIVERIELFCVGLCLDCLKSNDRCRVRHPDPFDKNLWIPLRRMGSDGKPDHGEDTKRPADWQSIW